jgi:tripeptide aminopeptidase
VDTATQPRASAHEREQLVSDFVRLCEIESPSRRERAMADAVTADLRALGLEVQEDASMGETGSDAGNLLARIPGPPDGRTILLCAHLDTVPLTAPVEPVVVDGAWENANEGILGADNKAALAVMLELARRVLREPGAPAVGLELLFTVCEEVTLLGAKEFDTSSLRSRYGYVFDHASPIGEIIVAAPTYYQIIADFHGRAAHAGIRPEVGRSAIAAAARGIAAMRLGRLDPETTANIGRIRGGTNANVVPEHCRVEAETRSLDAERAEAVATELIDHLNDAANAEECDLDVEVQRMFQGYRARARAPQIAVAERALRASGYDPKRVVTGGGSDANALQAAGFSCTNLANGTERNHEPGERVSVDALEGMFEVAIALLDEASHEATDGSP